MNCFFCGSLSGPSEIVTLDAQEARHAATSRRQRAGEQVVLIDGKGCRGSATIVTLDRKEMTLRIDTVDRLPRPTPDIVLAAAIAKGDRQSTLLDMAAQTGVFRYIPLICERSSVMPRTQNPARWRRILIQACKQSHNPYLPEIGEAGAPGELASSLAAGDTELFMATPEGEPQPSVCGAGRAAVFIGPEGGFSSTEEAELIEAGAMPLTLGNNVLRIETAAVAAVVAIQSAYRRFHPTNEE